jgi:hypothetical protein
MNIVITTDFEGSTKLPDAMGYLDEYRAVNRPLGRDNNEIYIQQHDGKQWVFDIWQVKAGFRIKITTKEYVTIT